MADSTEHESKRVTSGRRALLATWGDRVSGVPALYATGWADACAALVDGGWPTAARTVLAVLLPPADVDAAGRVLLGGIPPEPDDVAGRQLAADLEDLLLPASELPDWATIGVQVNDELIYARTTLDLDAAETESARQWREVTVAAYQTADAAPVVLLEVGASAPPVHLEPDQARRLSTALNDAAAVVDYARNDR